MPHRSLGHSGHVESKVYPARRLGPLLGPSFFFALSLVCLSSPGVGTRLFFVAMAFLTGLWFSRCWRSAVVLCGRGVLLRGQVRTSLYPWDQVQGASAAGLRTGSPLRGRLPYVNLVLQLTGGRSRAFPELAAPARSGNSVVTVVAREITARAAAVRADGPLPA